MQPLHDGHSVRLLEGGQAFFPALVQAIGQSQIEVRMETYIFSDDRSGQWVAQALMQAARRGVSVYLVADGAGTPAPGPALAAGLTAAGVHWQVFSPLMGLGWLLPSRWRRLHRKLCVVDGRVAFCGGINVLDDWFDPNHGSLPSPRFDFAVQVAGPLVRDVQAAMLQFWLRQKVAADIRGRDVPGAWAALQAAMQPLQAPRPAVMGNASAAGLHHDARAALLLRDNLRNRAGIEKAYRKAIGEARKEIIIANAYFIPGARLRRALIHAARRGVRVRLLLQGKYEYFMQFHAARSVLGALLAEGVEIHEYAASFLHAKVAVIDSRWATVGSSNLDPLSLLLAREANVVVANAHFAHELRLRLDKAMADHGRQLDVRTYASRPLVQRFLDRLAFAIMRVMLFLTGSRY
jgi:cardiolipin synthase A/B